MGKDATLGLKTRKFYVLMDKCYFFLLFIPPFSLLKEVTEIYEYDEDGKVQKQSMMTYTSINT